MPSLKVGEKEAGQRLDRFLRRALPAMPPSHIFKLIRTRKVRVNGRRARGPQILAAGDEVLLHLSEERFRQDRAASKRPARSIDFEVRFEDEDLLVVSKPPFLPVHPGAGHAENSLIDQVRTYLETRPEDFQPSLAHRLDRDTSGLVLVGKNYAAVRALGDMLRQGRVKKSYLALCRGAPRPERGCWRFAVERRDTAGRPRDESAPSGETQYRVAAVRPLDLPGAGEKRVSLLVLRLRTGRTHQIRSHLLQAGHPLAGDRRYGERELNIFLRRNFGLRRQFLHAYRLSLEHPLSGKPLRLSDPFPPDLERIVRGLRLGNPAD